MAVKYHKAAGCADDPESTRYFALTYGPSVLACDSRGTGDGIGGPIPVRVSPDEKGNVAAEPADASVRHTLAFSVPAEDGAVRLIDYASAGADWDNGTKACAWIREKD